MRVFIVGILFLSLLNQAHAVTKLYLSSTGREFSFRSETIPNGGVLQTTFTDAIDFNGLDFIIQTSSGSITTANVSWRTADGVTINSEVLTSGTPIYQMKAPIAVIQIINNTGASIIATGNITLRSRAISSRISSGNGGVVSGNANYALDSGLLNGLPSTAFLKTANNLSDLSNTSNARANLGLGDMARQPSNNVSISGGVISGVSMINPTVSGDVYFGALVEGAWKISPSSTTLSIQQYIGGIWVTIFEFRRP